MASWTNDPQTDRDVELIASAWETGAMVCPFCPCDRDDDITDRRETWSVGDRTSRHPGDGTVDMGTVTGISPDAGDSDYVVLHVVYDSGYTHCWSAWRWDD